jgi:hypothetical protein
VPIRQHQFRLAFLDDKKRQERGDQGIQCVCMGDPPLNGLVSRIVPPLEVDGATETSFHPFE